MSAYALSKIQTHVQTMDPNDITKIEAFVDEFNDNGEESAYPGMSYEQGLRDMLEMFMGETTADGITSG